MEIIDIGDGTCAKCHMELSQDEKRNRMPICTGCMTELVDIVKGSIGIDNLEKYSEDVSNFTDFVSSSARLMGLGDIIVVQVCFNIYMDLVRGFADGNPAIARKIFGDARRFIDIELERLEDPGEDDLSKNGDLGKNEFFEKMMSNVSKMMRDYHDIQSRNDAVNSGADDTNNEMVDNISDKDEGKGEIKKENKKGSKRIRVD